MIHFILTRFNLKLWPKDKNGARIDRNAWLKERMKLFEKYCYPSVKHQTCTEFRWALLMDDTTPDDVIKKLQKLKKGCPQMEIVKIPSEYSKQYAEVFQQYIRQGATVDEQVLTTYLDNDDALSYDYIERMQSAAESCEKRTVLSFPVGFQYFTSLKIATQVTYPNNHFITLVERADDLKTVYGIGSHYFIRQSPELDVKTVDGNGWVEVIHAGNVDNDVKMTMKTSLLWDTAGFQYSFDEGFEFVDNPRPVFYLRWIPRAAGQFIRRLGYKVKPRDWWAED